MHILKFVLLTAQHILEFVLLTAQHILEFVLPTVLAHFTVEIVLLTVHAHFRVCSAYCACRSMQNMVLTTAAPGKQRL